MSSNIVVLTGSPRKAGNTEKLAAAFVEGAKAAGKNVTLFRTADMKIGGCRGCEHCFEEKGVCVQKDDMPPILEALKNADALVLVSPVYYYDISAQLKLAVDRTFALISVGTPIKKAALIMTCGDDSEKAAEGSVVTFNSICAFSEWEVAGVVIATGLHNPGEIEGRIELEKARSLGFNI